MENSKKPTVFLGGTVAGSTWRQELISLLEIDYFNPVVDDWLPEHMEEELRQREICDYLLYVLTPKMQGVYSVAELVDDAHRRPERTVFTFLPEDGDDYFSPHQLKSMRQTAALVADLGVHCFDDLEAVAEFLNHDWCKPAKP